MNIPEGIRELAPKPIAIKNVKNVLIISDIHFPFHDKKAIEAAVNFRKNLDTIIILGDLLDMYSLSRFCKDPNYPRIKEECKIGKAFFEYLRGKFPQARLIWYEGNHDYRLRRYLFDKAPALENVDVILLESWMNLTGLNVEYIRNGNLLSIGALNLAHGNEAGMKGGINVARTMLLRAFDNVLFGNFHKTQEVSAKSLSGKELAAFSIGCLCQLNPAYLPINEHNHGFAFVEISGREFEVHNKRILSTYRVR